MVDVLGNDKFGAPVEGHLYLRGGWFKPKVLLCGQDADSALPIGIYTVKRRFPTFSLEIETAFGIRRLELKNTAYSTLKHYYEGSLFAAERQIATFEVPRKFGRNCIAYRGTDQTPQLTLERYDLTGAMESDYL